MQPHTFSIKWHLLVIFALWLGTWGMGCPSTTPGSEVAQETQAHSEAGQEKVIQEISSDAPGEAVGADTTTDREAQREDPGPEPLSEATPDTLPEATPELGRDTSQESPAKQEVWQTATSLPEKRQETAVVALNGEIYIVGGIDGNKSTVAIVEAYNPTTQQWRRLAPVPKPMHHANVAAYKGKIYVLGFLQPSFGADGGCFAYDPKTDQWATLQEMPASMRRGASVLGVVGDTIYVAGGFRGFRSVADLSAYDPQADSWKALAPIPTDLDHLAGGVIANTLVIAGGRHGNINSHIKATYAYDTSANKWTKKADMPTSRGGAAGAVYKGRLYIFGGEGNTSHPSGVFEQVESYELSTDTWRTHISMKSRRHGTNAATIGELIYVPGGADGQAFAAVDTVEIFVPNH